MSRKFIAAVLAASLTVTSFAAAPARADNGSTARALGTAATLFILGTAIANARDDNDRDRPRAHVPGYGPRPYRHGNGPVLLGRPGEPGRHHRAELPGRCLLEVRGASSRTILGARCLRERGVNVNRLPERCHIGVRTRHGTSHGYLTNCLSQAGYRIEGRRSEPSRRSDYWRNR